MTHGVLAVQRGVPQHRGTLHAGQSLNDGGAQHSFVWYSSAPTALSSASYLVAATVIQSLSLSSSFVMKIGCDGTIDKEGITETMLETMRPFRVPADPWRRTSIERRNRGISWEELR